MQANVLVALLCKKETWKILIVILRFKIDKKIGVVMKKNLQSGLRIMREGWRKKCRRKMRASRGPDEH
jgi:hypothetical protein